MKKTLIILGLIATIGMVSCSKDDDADVVPADPLAQLHTVATIAQESHEIEILSSKSHFEVGYNALYVRAKQLNSDAFITLSNVQWTPIMYMDDSMHGAPHSTLKLNEDEKAHYGHIIFQMAGHGHHYWDLELSYTLDGNVYNITEKIAVHEPADEMAKTAVFTGADDVNYILAYVSPKDPEVAINAMEAMLYTMEDSMTFNVVEDFTIGIDPRMPSMGNHGSPNNEALTYQASSKKYKGKLSLTMTGYWRINLKVFNAENQLVKGEDVTEDRTSSSIYFDLEF